MHWSLSLFWYQRVKKPLKSFHKPMKRKIMLSKHFKLITFWLQSFFSMPDSSFELFLYTEFVLNNQKQDKRMQLLCWKDKRAFFRCLFNTCWRHRRAFDPKFEIRRICMHVASANDLCHLFCAEESEGAGEDEEVPTARGAGVPHESDGHSDTARGAGEELSGCCGGLQENHWEASITGLMWLWEAPDLERTRSHITTDFLQQPRRCPLDAAKKGKKK